MDLPKKFSGLNPYSGPYLCMSLPIAVFANSSRGSTSTPLNFCIPFPAPTRAKLNSAPSVPNFNLFFNLLNASSLPCLSSRSNIVIAKGSNLVPLTISANVPISSSVTNASPTPAPIIPRPVGLIIFAPILDKLKTFPACFAATAFFAKLSAVLVARETPILAPA